ncbi:MAG: glutathione S-transferase [Planktomarina sp.]
MTDLPILYSFRRCPYAMRARLAIQSARITVELREIVLRDKAPAFLEASPKGTVPVLVHGDIVIEESLDVMRWALGQNDPEGWLDMPAAGHDWITRWDTEFKPHLDRTKYASRYPDADPSAARIAAHAHLADLEACMVGPFIFGAHATLADYAMLPFVRQFANVDRAVFDAQPWPKVHAWLAAFLESPAFATVMPKFSKWEDGDDPIIFPCT